VVLDPTELMLNPISLISRLVVFGGISIMNKILSLVLVATIAIVAIPYARGLGTPGAPPGIASDHWIAMGDAAGFVITDHVNDFRKGLRTDPNAIRGYFMVHHASAWLRVDPTPADGAYLTKLDH
jgi:hypothetical protein